MAASPITEYIQYNRWQHDDKQRWTALGSIINTTQLRPLSGTYGPLFEAKHSKDKHNFIHNSIFTCFFFFCYFIAKLKQTPFRGIKIKLDSLHKPPTSPVSWEVLSVKCAQAIYSAAVSLGKTISLRCSPPPARPTPPRVQRAFCI